MIRKMTGLSFLAALAMSGGVAIAAPITFSTEPGSSDFPTVTVAGTTGQNSLASQPNAGLILTVTANGGSNTISGSNDGGGGFGVLGNGSFDINNRDAGSDESLILSFNQDVFLNGITFKVVAFADAVQLDISSLSISTEAAGNSSFTPTVTGLSTTGNATGPFALSFTDGAFLLGAGETIVIGQGANSNNGILLESITATPIPEPGSLGLTALGAMAFAFRRRKPTA
jgi:hypothetical protein